MSQTTRERRESTLARMEGEVNRANDNAFCNNETTFTVRALLELGRILAGIEEALDVANGRRDA